MEPNCGRQEERKESLTCGMWARVCGGLVKSWCPVDLPGRSVMEGKQRERSLKGKIPEGKSRGNGDWFGRGDKACCWKVLWYVAEVV